MRKILAAALVLGAATAANASESAKPAKQDWSFSGVLGTFDRAQLKRGLTVYQNVCSACHALNQLYYRNLTEIGLSPDQVAEMAAAADVQDGPNDDGEMFTRPGRPSDRIKRPFPNEQAARAANNGAAPPDLSLIVKAREGGADYVHGILTGYGDPPAGVTVMPGMNYNKQFPGHQIAMAPPLSDGQVDYEDGTKATVEQMSKDVTTFLAWAAEPEMEVRKRLGVKVILFLIVLTTLLYAVKRKVWADVH